MNPALTPYSRARLLAARLILGHPGGSPMSKSRLFTLDREVDHSGLSGTGTVADGVVFPDGTAVVRWREVSGVHYDRGVRATTVVFPNVEAVEALHGHGGATRIVWGG